jgi:predicted GH43/DUF377 family glycosyl hydrolase
LNGSNPSQILQRSTVPLLQPKYDWEIGRAPAQCNVHDVVFVEAMRKIGGCSQSFQLYFGGADAVIGTATVVIHPSVGAASDSC